MTTLLHRGPLRAASLFQRASPPTTIRLSFSPSTPITIRRPPPLHLYASTAPSIPEKVRKDTINPPASTRPAPIETPLRKSYTSLPKYLFALGKTYATFYKTGTYATFYKTGVKSIYHNFRAAQALEDRIVSHQSHANAVAAGALTRADYQLVLRSWHDLKRVPLFGLLFIVCGEFTPLIVVAVSSIVPWTCRIPRQIAADRQTLETRRGISFRNLTSSPPSAAQPVLNRQQLLHISWSLGLSSKIWDYVNPGTLPGPPDFILKSRVRERVRYLELDDKLLSEAGKEIKKLENDEVKMALVERGIDILQRGDEELMASLEAWLKSRGKGRSVESLLLTRPNVWPIPPTSPKKD
ncbi:hypothetical protein HYALB_00005395 [Hymenoscyphus albidus]|uniref:Letm1 RBD domain-containing protein n=1 Tax=Hymenoscyphus albidus TaxID=595503 RepID=A0A9N9LHC9_9HELO|nr:hypothetical protein HYALB_00005395 [Hymenoscyphus albidus]